MYLHLCFFIIASFVLAIIPGPDMIYILNHSLAQGAEAGFMALLGISTGLICHITLLALGISPLLFSHHVLFEIIKLLGALYLLFIAIQMLRHANAAVNSDQKIAARDINYYQIYRQGLMTNLLNPKIAFFFIAFLPQFVSNHIALSMSLQLLALGVLFTVIGLAINAGVALFAAKIRLWFKQKPQFLKKQLQASAFILAAFALGLSFFNRSLR